MNQIITQHGWALDQNFWNNYKIEFQKNAWYWQDNERGYFSKNSYKCKWIKNSLKKNVQMILCHSLGFKLIDQSLLDEASHIVLINSFYNFLPSNKKRSLILRSLKRMEKKIIMLETRDMLIEFIRRSFMPNNIDINFQKIFHKNLESINNPLLLQDLKKLYSEETFTKSINENTKVFVLKSKNDLILDNDSSNDFIELLNKKLIKKPILIELSNQGHCLTNLNLFRIINKALEN